MAAFVAFLHHVAAFTLVAALAVEFVLIRDELTVRRARSLQIVDALTGASAGIVLVAGLLRVFYFEKGASYYWQSAPFLAKFALFVAVGLLSIYPTIQFLSWSKSLKEGQVPRVEPGKLATLRRIIHWELAAVVLLILCAAVMAKGIGHLG